jgi:hypothetical protein|tara:strand:- start:2674 stop:2847 length:174 start_codon:yes stop_codon:yes gene_type:complete
VYQARECELTVGKKQYSNLDPIKLARNAAITATSKGEGGFVVATGAVKNRCKLLAQV